MDDQRRNPWVHAQPPPPRAILDESPLVAPAWARFRQILRWTGALALLLVAIVWSWLYREFGMVSIHLYIATALGIVLTALLFASLMGLMFVSNRTGHDETIEDPLDNPDWHDD